MPASRISVPFTAAPRKVDVFARHRGEYAATRAPGIVTTGPGRYLTIQGRGEPGGEPFREQVGALYGMAWTVKMAMKVRGKDFKIPPLEGLWWPAAAGGDDPAAGQWNWKLLLRVPNFVKKRELEPAAKALAARGRASGADAVRLEEMREGRCVQALHVGPYATEPETLDRMRRAAADLGLVFRGRQHHEIYLSDPRRVAPERLRTILRIPVRAAR